MKKALLLILILFIISGCNTNTSFNESENVGIAIRDFSFSRVQDGNLQALTETDIPNDYQCHILESTVFDMSYDEVFYFGIKITNGDEYKQVRLTDDQYSIPIKEIQSLYLTIFCAHKDLALKNELYKEYR